ncbi:MAG: hypothetical protein ABEK12_03505, partial [Candidatus Nanohaloarchaea archaeon]
MDDFDILFITRTYADDHLITEHLRAVADELADRGGSATVVCFDDHHTEEQDGDIDIHRVNFPLDGD